MNEKSSSSLTVGLFAISVAIVVFGFTTSAGLKSIKRSGDQITVTGSAKRAITSDFIIWRGSVSAQRATLADAYAEIEKHQGRIREYLKQNKVPDEAAKFNNITSNSIQEYSSNGMPTGKIFAYECTVSFEVRSSNVNDIAGLSNRATELIKEGIPLNSFSPEYLYTKLADVRIEMLGEATRDARARAEKIAENAGCKLSAVRSARMGVFQVTPRNSTDVSDYGYYDTSSLEKDITSVVTLGFSVE